MIMINQSSKSCCSVPEGATSFFCLSYYSYLSLVLIYLAMGRPVVKDPLVLAGHLSGLPPKPFEIHPHNAPMP